MIDASVHYVIEIISIRHIGRSSLKSLSVALSSVISGGVAGACLIHYFYCSQCDDIDD